MKINVTITKTEVEETKSGIWIDPCAFIRCGDIDCERCPLREKAAALREAQNKFIYELEKIEVADEKAH